VAAVTGSVDTTAKGRAATPGMSTKTWLGRWWYSWVKNNQRLWLTKRCVR
jgi:hypothetical protein